MNKVTIDRPLLEDLRDAANDCLNHAIMRGNDRNVPAYTELVEQADAALEAPRHPEGEGLEVVGYRVSLPDEPELGRWLDESAENEPQMCLHEPLCLLSDHQRAIAELRELVGAAQRVTCAVIDERDSLRQQLAERDAEILEQCRLNGMGAERELKLIAQRDKLADLLVDVKSDLSAAMNWGDLDRIAVRIDAALAEVDK